MALTKLEKDMSIIAALDDEPNDVGGLTAGELKNKFDEAGMALKAYLNDTLTVEIDAQKADRSELHSIVLGQIPDGTVTAEKLERSARDMMYRYVAEFESTDWSEGTITIPRSTHRLGNGMILCTALSVTEDGGYRRDTWAAAETYASSDTATGTVTLHSDTPYTGRAILQAL